MLIDEPGFTGNAPGGPSRWNNGEQNEWYPLRSKLIVEVSFDQVTGGRFWHDPTITLIISGASMPVSTQRFKRKNVRFVPMRF